MGLKFRETIGTNLSSFLLESSFIARVSPVSQGECCQRKERRRIYLKKVIYSHKKEVKIAMLNINRRHKAFSPRRIPKPKYHPSNVSQPLYIPNRTLASSDPPS